MLSQAVENYLKVIFSLEERDGRVATSAIADRMGIAPASATSMIKRLSKMRLVNYEPYQGVRLTPTGRVSAVEIVRHHRLIELFLAEVLGMPWDRVHEEADKLEHALSEELEARISEALGNPTVDPHGAPIPGADGTIRSAATRPLRELLVGETAAIVEVDDEDAELLRYLGRYDLFPGALIRVVSLEPFGGPVIVDVGGREVSLGAAAVAGIRVADVIRQRPGRHRPAAGEGNA